MAGMFGFTFSIGQPPECIHMLSHLRHFTFTLHCANVMEACRQTRLDLPRCNWTG